MVIISAGTVLLPACRTDKTVAGLKNISLKESQQEMLSQLTETIIPSTPKFIGAKELKSHEFLLRMIDDCTSPEDQKKFTDGLKAFEEACDKIFKTSFVKCTPQQRTEFLKELEASKDDKDLAARFYKTTKRYTVQSFTSSKEYMVDVRKWKMVPGSNFKGSVKI
jgi:hypothetical protein